MKRKMKFNLNNTDEFKEKVPRRVKRVREMLDKQGRNIYHDITGHEDEVNYELYDAGKEQTGLERHVVSLTVLFPGEVNGQFKMTTGHSHPQEEVYQFLSGEGQLILKDENLGKEEIHNVSAGTVVTIPSGVWHRVVNTGDEQLKVFCIFETYEGRGI